MSFRELYDKLWEVLLCIRLRMPLGGDKIDERMVGWVRAEQRNTLLSLLI